MASTDTPEPASELREDGPADVPLTDAEKAVRADQTHDDEHDHDPLTDADHKRPPWAETGEHPNHPEVAGEPDPAG